LIADTSREMLKHLLADFRGTMWAHIVSSILGDNGLLEVTEPRFKLQPRAKVSDDGETLN